MSADLVRVDPERFAVAWHDQRAHDAYSLTEAWLASFRSEHTQTNYRRDLMAWLGWCDLCKVSPPDARIAHADMWIAKQRRDGAAEASIARRISAVASWYGYLIENTAQDPVPLATHNPAKTRARPKIDPDYSPTTGLATAETDRLIAAADAHSLVAAALIRLLLLDALRIGSAIDAKITDLGHDRGHRTLTLTVKGGTKRRVPIPPMVGTSIDAMLAARGNPTEGPLFLTTRGLPLYELWTWRLLRKLAGTAGIEAADNISPHSLRHTAITDYLDAGGTLRDAQDLAGHKDPRTTRRYDRGRNSLDRHGSYLLASRYAERHSD